MMRQEYLKKTNFFSSDELSTLARVLGFPGDLLLDCLRDPRTIAEGIEAQGLKFLFEDNFFHRDLDKTFNSYDAAYNCKVFLTAIDLLCTKRISFSQLSIARISFQTFEHSDRAGMEDGLLLRALKLCDKIVASLRLKQMLRRMKRLVADRVMFYEFLYILVRCEDICQVARAVGPKFTPASGKDIRGTFELCRFEDELITEDERFQKHLNSLFEESLKAIAVRESDKGSASKNMSPTKTVWVTPPLVNQKIREAMAKQSRQQYLDFVKILESSSLMVKIGQCEGGRNCNPVLPSKTSSDGKHVAKETAQNSCETACHTQTSLSPIRRSTVDWIVTDQDIMTTNEALHDMEWRLAIQNRKVANPRRELTLKSVRDVGESNSSVEKQRVGSVAGGESLSV